MATLNNNELPFLFDMGLDGVGYLVAWEIDKELLSPWKAAYTMEAADALVERRDQLVTEMSENKLDFLWWLSQRSWVDGAGQDRFSAPQSSNSAFSSSRGVDVTVPGQATILPAMAASALTLTNRGPSAPQKMTFTDTYGYVAAPQPNVQRFSATDGSDHVAVSTATETAQPVYDLANDGVTVYAALGADGTHKAVDPGQTLIESFDSTAGWTIISGTGTVFTADTNRQEGTASLKIDGTVPNTFDVYKTVALDLSSYDSFKLWAYLTGNNNFVGYTLRLVTSVGNYFEYVNHTRFPSFTTTAWSQVSISRTTGFTTVGSPVWTNITRIEFLSGSRVIVQFDDLEGVVAGNFAHFSDWDCRTLGWAKDRLYGAGVKTGTTWRFFEVGSLATSTEWLQLPQGWTVSSIVDLGGFVYFSASRGTRGVIYAFDGTNPPFVASPLPTGDVPLTLVPFLGAGMLVGTRRVGATTASGQGVLYRAFPVASGHLTLERVATLGTANDGIDYGIGCGYASGDKARFAWNNPDGTTTGLGVYDPTYGAYSRGSHAVTSGVVAAAGLFKGRRMMTVDGVGLFTETADANNNPVLVADPYIIGSRMDWNIDGLKMVLKGEAGFLPLPAGGSVIFDYSTDGGTTWTTIVTDTTTNDELAGAPVRVSARSMQYRVRMTPGTGNTQVTLKKAGLGAVYGSKPRRVYTVAVKAYGNMTLKNSTPYPLSGASLPHQIEAALLALRDSQKIVQFQPPGYGEEHTDVVNVRVASIIYHRHWIPRSGWANLAKTTLVEVPA